MELIKAAPSDFERITDFYREVILNTENMSIYAKWIYGQHPTDEMIKHYIDEGVMYFCEKDGEIVSAAALTPYQGDDYHKTDWAISLADDEVSVVHILCVSPNHQKQGIARQTMQLFIDLSNDMNKKAIRLDALACNTPAHKLYEKLGFKLRGKQHWYADNVGWTDFFLYEYIL